MSCKEALYEKRKYRIVSWKWRNYLFSRSKKNKIHKKIFHGAFTVLKIMNKLVDGRKENIVMVWLMYIDILKMKN